MSLIAANSISDAYEGINRIGRIPVRNLWLLMLYASDLFRDLEKAKVAVEDNPDDIPNLVAEMLCRKVERRIRRNLSYGYQSREAVLGRLRGRVDLLKTESHRLLDRGKVACRFDELTVDTARNRLVRAALEEISKIVFRAGLGSVDIHLSARRQPARCIIAAKLVSVFSYLVAMRRNCLRSQKKFSTRWRHLYIPKSHGIERARSALGGITAMAPRLSSSARIQSMSKALSASRASKSIPSINGATPMLSWRWPGSSRKRVRLPSASTSATIFVVSPPRDRPMA